MFLVCKDNGDEVNGILLYWKGVTTDNVQMTVKIQKLKKKNKNGEKKCQDWGRKEVECDLTSLAKSLQIAQSQERIKNLDAEVH